MRCQQVGGQEGVKESKLVCLTLSCLPTLRQRAFQTVALFVYLMKSLLLRKYVLGDRKFDVVAYICWQCSQMLSIIDLRHCCVVKVLCTRPATCITDGLHHATHCSTVSIQARKPFIGMHIHKTSHARTLHRHLTAAGLACCLQLTTNGMALQ